MTDDERRHFADLLRQTNAKLDAILEVLDRGEAQRATLDAAIAQLRQRINETQP